MAKKKSTTKKPIEKAASKTAEVIGIEEAEKLKKDGWTLTDIVTIDFDDETAPKKYRFKK